MGIKNGVYLARFRFQSREYKRSLKTVDRKAAEAAMRRVEDALHRLAIGVIAVPSGVDVGDFIVSGGTLTAPAPEPCLAPAPTFDAAVAEYTANLGHLAELNRATVRTHLKNPRKKLGAKAAGPLDRIELRDLEAALQVRLRERSATTVSKERMTIGQFFDWAAARRYLLESPADGLMLVKPAGDLPPFRTYADIEAVVARGGLTPREVLRLWDTLFLTPAEIAELLALVRGRSRHDVSIILHAVPAYTGMRRGEVLRLRWTDIEFEQDAIIARSRKQSRQRAETTRRIDLHPELKAILLAWRERRPVGQFVACDPRSTMMLTSRQATTRFFQPLSGTKWCLSRKRDWYKIGYHTYRHSFASNLAAAGVDQRVIDEFMGHQTEAMRKRYRHLFPANRRAAIQTLTYALGSTAPAVTTG